MSTVSYSMTQGRLGRQILLFSLPLMASNLLQVLFNMSDIAVVGRFAGPAALGAVGSTSTLVTLFTGFLIGLGGGVNALVARHYGAQDRDGINQTVSTALLVCLLFGAVLLGAGLGGARTLLELLHTKEELLDGALRYLHIYFLGMPALALYNYGNAVFSAFGQTRRPLIYLAAAGVLNIALNLFFVIVCNLAEAGVAIASVISQYLSGLLLLFDLLRGQKRYGLKIAPRCLSADNARSVLVLGVPAGLQNAIFAIANLFVQAGVNSFETVMVEGNAAASNADGLVYDVMAAFYVACSSFMGQNLGAGNRDRVKKSYLISLAYSFGIGALLGLGLVLFGRTFLGLFTQDAAVAEAGMYRLRIMGFSYMVSAFMDCTIAASRGLGKSIVPTVIVILGSCVFRVVWVYTVFAWFGTIASLYLLYIFSWSITAAAEIFYFVRCYRRLSPAAPAPIAA